MRSPGKIIKVEVGLVPGEQLSTIGQDEPNVFTGDKKDTLAEQLKGPSKKLGINIDPLGNPPMVGASSPINPLLDMSQVSGFPQVVESKITNPRATSIDQEQSLKGSIVGDVYLKTNDGKGASGLGLSA